MLPALALVHACGTLVVDGDEPEMRESVQSAFEARADIDTCARVTLTTRGAGTIVTVTLPDGRTTTRVVPSENVIAALEPLLVVPEEEHEAVAQSAPPPVTLHIETPAPVVIVVEHDSGLKRFAPAKASSFAMEASLALGLRTADDRPGAGIGMTAWGDSNGWLGGLEGRFDRYDGGPRTDPGVPMGGETQALSLAAVAGRRARLGFVSFDLYAGAGLAQLWSGHEQEMVHIRDADGRMRTASAGGSALLPQFRLGTRLTLRARSLLRVFLAVDGDARAGGDELLPQWSAGASLGLAVGS